MKMVLKGSLGKQPLPEERQGTSGAIAGRCSMRTDSDEMVNRRPLVGLPETSTAEGRLRRKQRQVEDYEEETFVPASQPLMDGTSAKETSKRRMKWNEEMNRFIFRTYLEITKMETDKTMYRGKLHHAFITQYPHLAHITEQRIADQRRVIIKNTLLTLDTQEQIKHETEALLNTNNTLTVQDNTSVLSNYEIQTFTTHNQSIDPNNHTNQTLTSLQDEFNNALLEFSNTDPTQRSRIPKQSHTTKLHRLTQALNDHILPNYINDETNLHQLHFFVYCGAVAVSRCNGSRITINKQQHTTKKRSLPAWEKRLINRIDDIRRDLGRITQYIHGNRSSKLTRQVQHITTKLNNHTTREQNTNYNEHKDTLTQKLSVYTNRLKRYRETVDRKRHNTQFKRNEKLFYRSLTQNNTHEKLIPPSLHSLQQYWSDLWTNDIKHNPHSSWITAETTRTEYITPMNDTNITTADIIQTISHLHNWKSPGIDNIHNFWWKYFTYTHSHLAQHFTELLKSPNNTPAFFTQGITYMLPKDNNTQDPSKYRPITCLPTIYKILTSCITNKIYKHCTDNNILYEEQKGCTKYSRGCKEQLIIDSVILEQSRHNKRNIHTAYIDYKKAFDSVPHSWLQQVLSIYKVNHNITQFISYIMSCWNTTLT